MPEMDEDDELALGPDGSGLGGLNLLPPGIPPGVAPAHLAPLDQLRYHPQFNALRQV
jgi:hypothetical protein